MNLYNIFNGKRNTLAIHGGNPISRDKAIFKWPIIDSSLEKKVIQQLHESLSIYDDSGIFKKFEDEFAAYHSMPHALLTNSGTSALQTAYFSIGIKPGDEIICPAYTFHATVSPMMHFGGIPIMTDCDEYGQIDPGEIESCLTEKTRAVVVTHMWGYAAQIEKIREICDKRNLILIEDCSHAHGGRCGNKMLGLYGDISVWSLQGQKIITGGEGGIMLFKDRKFFERSVLYGHYNKRCKSQIKDEALKKFALTGSGYKLRASTLNIAIAKHIFDSLDSINSEKNFNAMRFEKEAAIVPGIQILSTRTGSTNSWYAQVILYDEKTVGVPRDLFVKALHAEGLIEFDIPGSTCLINNEPLFNVPHEIFPHLYHPKGLRNDQREFPNAQRFYNRIIKIPVWTSADNKTDLYIKGFNKVVNLINDLK